jgi:hypothetical protein
MNQRTILMMSGEVTVVPQYRVGLAPTLLGGDAC